MLLAPGLRFVSVGSRVFPWEVPTSTSPCWEGVPWGPEAVFVNGALGREAGLASWEPPATGRQGAEATGGGFRPKLLEQGCSGASRARGRAQASPAVEVGGAGDCSRVWDCFLESSVMGGGPLASGGFAVPPPAPRMPCSAG